MPSAPKLFQFFLVNVSRHLTTTTTTYISDFLQLPCSLPPIPHFNTNNTHMPIYICIHTKVHTHTLHSSLRVHPGDTSASPPAQQEWQLCRLSFFNGILPLMYRSWGMHHLLSSYCFLSTCHLTLSAAVRGGMGLRWHKKGGHRGHYSPSGVVHHWHLHCKKYS